MNELIDFLVEITENSQHNIENEEWEALRPLTPAEISQLWEIDEAWAELEVLKAEVQCALTEERRASIRSRHDLTDEELELLGRLMLARDVYQATQNAFWSPIKYELRAYEHLMLDTEKAAILGRGNNRKNLHRPLEPVGLPNAEEIERLTQLFGE
jgi:hypothetical protein